MKNLFINKAKCYPLYVFYPYIKLKKEKNKAKINIFTKIQMHNLPILSEHYNQLAAG